MGNVSAVASTLARMHAMRPVEWIVLHPLDNHPLALVRLIHLGPTREPYYRAVTADSDPASRELLGYWASAELAEEAVCALWEQRTGKSLSGGGAPARGLPVPPMKPPPSTTAGHAVPDVHASRR